MILDTVAIHPHPLTRPPSPTTMDPPEQANNLETVSSLHLPKPFLVSKIAPSSRRGQPIGIGNAVTSLSDPEPDSERTYCDMTHPITSYGSSTVRARPIKALLSPPEVITGDEEVDRPVVLSLPRSISSSSGRRYDSIPNSLQNRLKPLTAIRVDQHDQSIPILQPQHNHEDLTRINRDGVNAEYWDKILTAMPQPITRIPSSLSICVTSSLQSVSLSTVKPDTLAHHRQLEEYNAILAALARHDSGNDHRQDHTGAANEHDHETFGHGRGLSVESGPVKVDELAVEWCFFCGRERMRSELELVDLAAPVGAVGGIGAGEQWVCRGHCEEREEVPGGGDKSPHGMGFEGVAGKDWGSIKGEQGSTTRRVEHVHE